jgi:hypothetical protein
MENGKAPTRRFSSLPHFGWPVKSWTVTSSRSFSAFSPNPPGERTRLARSFRRLAENLYE